MAFCNAPHNDLQLWHELNQYRELDPKVADAAIAALQRHFWYLTEECVVFSFFAKRVPDVEKQQMAQQMLRYEPPKQFEAGMSKFPVLNRNTMVSSLIGENFWFLFHCLGTNTSWLGKSVELA